MRSEREGSVVFNGGREAGFGKRGFYTTVAVLAALFAFVLFAVPAWGQTVNKTSPAEVRLGQTFEYRIEVTRAKGSNEAFLEDTLPSGVTFVEFTTETRAECTPPVAGSREFTCTFTGLTNSKSGIVEVEVVADKVGGQTNVAHVRPTETAAIEDTDTATTIVQTRNGKGKDRRDDRRDRFDRFDRFPPFFRQQYQDEDDFFTQEEQYEDAENDLEGEATDDEFDDEGDDDGGVSANAEDGFAEASTPGAVATAGDPDELAPETSVPGDVIDEIPTSGPLPETGGTSLANSVIVVGMVLLGAGLLVIRLAAIWRGRRA